MYTYLFIWFFFIVINFQIWVCKENVYLFIHIVLFYSYKFLKMGIQGDESSFFGFKLKSLSEVDRFKTKSLSEIGPKHTTIKLWSWSFFSKCAKFYVVFKNAIKISEKAFGFEDIYVWTCCKKLSQIWRENMW